MAYADYQFYTEKYFGDTLEYNFAPKWLEKASDTLDSLTYNRLSFAFPTVEAHANKAKKAVCAIADALYLVDIQKTAVSAQKTEDGEIHGAISSISSGRESISYVAKGADSVYGKAASDEKELARLLYQITLAYLAGIPDANGINLLYGGLGNV